MTNIYKSIVYLVHRWILKTPYLKAHSQRFNLYFNFNTPDVIGRHLYKGRVHEEEITDFLLEYLQFNDGDIWFDVGANIGWYSLVLSKEKKEKAIVHAFEPDPLNYKLLEKNVALNQAPSVVCVNKALSDQEETRTLYQYPSKNLGRHSLLPINEGAGQKVETISLDKYVSDHDIDIGRVKFIKMDIEGYEYIALKGAKTLLENTPTLLCEFSPVYMKRGGIDSRELLDLMGQFDYQPSKITDGQLSPLTREEILSFTGNVNIVWKKVTN